jgi:hypothetical protein
LNFIGHDGTNRVAIGGITARVSGAVSLGIVPGELTFDTRNTAGVLSVKAILTSSGAWQVDTISSLTTNSDIAISGNGTGNVNIESVKISGSTISTTDSSNIIISQASTFSSNLIVDGNLRIGDSIVQNSVTADYISTTLQTQGIDRVVSGVQSGTYTQLVSNTPETYTTISYNATTYRGCKAIIKVSWGASVIYIGEVLLANTTNSVNIVNAQDDPAITGTGPVSLITADYDSASDSVRLRPVTATVIGDGANYLWTVSYQLFT